MFAKAKDRRRVIVNNVFNDKWRILAICFAVCSCAMMCCVPSVFCYADRSRQLTFDKIYNNTKYPQIQYTPRPYYYQYQKPNKDSRYKYNNTLEEYKGLNEENNLNDIDYTFDDERNVIKYDNSLLVGFSHDPYRNSVPEPEFVKGVRDTKTQYVPNKGERGKRGVIHLYNMIYCATGCDPISYKGYGCYCGFLGSGRYMDGIDRCCKMHDKCYENIYCPFFTVYFQPYYWKCYHGQPLCALENHRSRNQFINGCAAKLCECDRRFAMCLQRYRCPRGRALCTSQPLRLLQNLLMFP